MAHCVLKTNIFGCLGFPVWRVAQHSQLQVINHFSTLRKDGYQHASYLDLPFLSQCRFSYKEGHPSSNRERNLVTLDIPSRSGIKEPGAQWESACSARLKPQRVQSQHGQEQKEQDAGEAEWVTGVGHGSFHLYIIHFVWKLTPERFS